MDSKAFESVTIDQFARFAAKARLPKKLTLDTVRATVAAFRDVWRESTNFLLDDRARAAINKHLKTIPIWFG